MPEAASVMPYAWVSRRALGAHADHARYHGALRLVLSTLLGSGGKCRIFQLSHGGNGGNEPIISIAVSDIHSSWATYPSTQINRVEHTFSPPSRCRILLKEDFGRPEV
jgi:hypothetical protein